MAKKKANILDRFMGSVDNFQRSHKFLGFPYAVIKKYGEEETAYQGALLTYYGFLSLFPLLLIATTFFGTVLKNNEDLKNRAIESIGHYFPVLSSQLEQQVHTIHKAGPALLIGILVTLYGARGVADAFQKAINHIWQVPRVERDGFPRTMGRSFAIITIGGMGFIIAAALSGWVSGLGHSLITRVASVLISVALLSGVFFYVYRLGLSSKTLANKYLLLSGIFAAIGVLVLQTFGYYLITHHLKNLSLLYGTFAVVLGLMFWIYLQAQVVLYSAVISSVLSSGVWPRSLVPKNGLTEGDKKAYKLLAKSQRYLPPEYVGVSFKEK